MQEIRGVSGRPDFVLWPQIAEDILWNDQPWWRRWLQRVLGGRPW